MSNCQGRFGDLLERITAAPADRRVALLQDAGEPAMLLAGLAEEVERLAITHIQAALQGGQIIVALADALGDAGARCRARRARAQSLAYAGRFHEALPVYERAIALADGAGLDLEAAQARLASIHALVHLARYDEAIAAGRAARRAFVTAGAAFDAARADNSIGGVYQKRGDPAKALRYFERARSGLASDSVALAQLDSNRGLALQDLDRFPDAQRAFGAALPAFEQAGMDWASAIVAGNLAVLATRQGRLQDALYYFEIARRHLEHDTAPAERARALVEQADALLHLHLPRQAVAQYEQALPLLRRHGQVREALQALAGRGRALALLDRRDVARDCLDQAAAEYERLGQRLDRARLDLVRAELLLRENQPEAARRLARQALDTCVRHPADACVARYYLARAALAAGDVPAAERTLARAVAAAGRLDITPLLADLLHVRGLVHRAAGRASQALADLRRGVECIERVRGSLQAERFRAAFHGNRLRIHEDLIGIALELGTERVGRSRPKADECLALAFETIERARSRVLLDLTQRMATSPDVAEEANADTAGAELARRLERTRAELDALYSRLADAHFAGEEGASTATLQRRVRRRERDLMELESRLATTRGVARLGAPPIGLPAAQRMLPAGTALVEYATSGEQVHALVVRPDGACGVRGLARRRELADAVRRLRFHIRRALRPGRVGGTRGRRLLADVRRQLGALHGMVWAPLAHALADCSRLWIVPHGVLHAVPMHALWDGRQYVIENTQVAYSPSASLLAARSADERALADGPMLVVGVPDERAPHIAEEARRIANVFHVKHVLSDGEATAARFKQMAPQAATIHLAAHGHFSADNPRGSGIRLADRWLTVREIGELNLSARLVTLAGCETGRSVIGTGDELLGLLSAFLAAGAGSLITSLWMVHDKFSADLMVSLYSELVEPRHGRSPAAALRHAQLEALAERPHPAFWAPYIVHR